MMTLTGDCACINPKVPSHCDHPFYTLKILSRGYAQIDLLINGRLVQSKPGAISDPGCEPLEPGRAGFGGPQIGLQRFFEQALIGGRLGRSQVLGFFQHCMPRIVRDTGDKAKVPPQLVSAPGRALPGLLGLTCIGEPAAMAAQKTAAPRLLA